MDVQEKPKGKLRTGFTTGTSATAASMAAILSIINQKEILRMLNAAKFWLKFRIIKHKKHLGISKSIKHALDTEFKK